MNRFEIAANLPPVQYGFRLETSSYQEKLVPYQGQTVLYYQYVMGTSVHAIRVVPDGCMDVLICCDPLRPHSLMCGTILQGETIPFHAGATYFGVRLTPLQSLYLSPTPFRDLIDRQPNVSDVMRGAESLCDDIAELELFEERIAHFEKYLLPRLLSSEHPTGLLPYCLQQIYQSKGNVTVDTLAEDIGLSSRYIRKKFVDTLGLSPKQYSRITRFQNTLSAMMNRTSTSGTIANEHGYYDQAHFIKDFKHFSLFTPMQIIMLLQTPPL
ncbi:helix-turn-helix domain-containing protein [Brevibacillus centrosporus]|uniref:helix-turn-helix domain-containing protein n=1 Tax=Brevibacillus centrosporus TaxID=54910 RepID=UPI002E22C531|nr:helix-turn-helix domain-containing protein [Brevibacillus centrosporus]MED1953499.1 helix-turn-helix domain-containing protein [Brevibacillus centrosporus]